jgi:hypothetical protein
MFTGVELTTGDGTVHCFTVGEGRVTTNSAKSDVFTTVDGPDSWGECFFSEGALAYPGLTEVTLGATGKATLSANIPVDFAAPYEKCVYAGTLKGTNTTSGVVKATLSGKLKGTDCPGPKAEAITESFTAESLPGEELVDDHVT